jgi:beta-N-acetylhexosaminidase
MALKAFIVGTSGPELTSEERTFLSEARPCGLILFSRNCVTPDQLSRLVADFRDAVGEAGVFALIDQEGGRVQRLRRPHWREAPPARAFGKLYEEDPERGLEAARLVARLTAQELSQVSINVNCAPVLDLPAPGAHGIIGDRAFHTDPHCVAELGRAAAEGYLEGGVLPVVKHIPGHGRAMADSHLSLPRIDAPASELEQSDYQPFSALNDMPLAMTAHVLIPELDPERPASVSPVIMDQVIREMIGFEGLVMCDDLSMGALEGSIAERAEAVISAGCDVVLHCNGILEEMRAAADVVPEFEGKHRARFEAAIGRIKTPAAFDEEKASAYSDEVAALA